MSALTIRAVVKDGLVHTPEPLKLADGTAVDIIVVVPEGAGVMPFTPEEQAEFDAWEGASDEAFQMILDLEREEERKNASR